MNSQIEEWLNERREDFLNDGQNLFNSFKEEFKVSTDEARELIHSWDAKVRNIKRGNPRVE
tara:strand:- start:1915 stop:2097 length:183 start_codon:yes stop_codon:yes gene_type:complete